MLGTGELWGDERSMMSLFFPEYFLVAMPIGLILNGLNGGLRNGPIMNLSLISWSKRGGERDRRKVRVLAGGFTGDHCSGCTLCG